MKKKIFSSIYILLAFTVLSLSAFACDSEAQENITINFEQNYSIEPTTLLDSIARDGRDLFKPIKTRPALPSIDQQITVNWHQEDYSIITQAIFENVWQDTLDGWSISSMNFALGCAKINSGFQNAQFNFFKNIKKDDHEIRVERFINIDPRSKSIYVSESEDYPRLTNWKAIDMTQLQYSADDALKISDNNGGQEVRLAAKNICDISVLLSPDTASYRGWDVRYSNKDEGRMFHIQIDPLTGKLYFPK